MNQLLVVVFISVVGVIIAKPADQYTTKYDNMDLEQVLRSDRLLGNYMNCLMDRGKCTPDGIELKDNLPDALQTGCSKCSETQKKAGYRVVDFLIDNKPDLWKELEAKFDPEGTYSSKYKSEIEGRKAKVAM